MAEDHIDYSTLTRRQIVIARARLMADPEFCKAVSNGEWSACDTIRDISKRLIETGGGTLTQDEYQLGPLDQEEVNAGH